MQPELQGIDISLEIGHPVSGRAGELHEFLQTKLSSSFSGVTIEEHFESLRTVVTVYAYCAGPVDRQAVEGLARMAIDAFQPKEAVSRMESTPTVQELLDRVKALEQWRDEFQPQLDKLSAAIGKSK